MKSAVTTLCLVCVVLATALHGYRAAAASMSSSPQEAALWEKANSLYLKKSWDSAAFYYNRIIAAGQADAAVYYNLGNTHFRLGHTGAAILNYERALRRKPDYKAAAENLELAQTRIPNRLQPPEDAFFVEWWQALSASGSSTVWAVAAVLLFTLALALLWRRRQRRGRIPAQLIVAPAVLWALCLAMAMISAGNAADGGDKAVVIRPKAVLKTADGKNIVGVPEGTTVMRKATNAGSLEVILPDGRRGWLPEREVAVVD